MRKIFITFLKNYKLGLNIIIILIGLAGLYVLYNLPDRSVNAEDKDIVIESVEQDQNAEIPEFVDIEGSIKSPGVYQIQKYEILFQVIERAGGFSQDVDKTYVQYCINLSQKLKDEQKIYIPSLGENFSCGTSSEFKSDQSINNESEENSSVLININKALKEELETLDGVGSATADKIIAARPYEELEDLLNVSGIGDATYQKFKDEITL